MNLIQASELKRDADGGYCHPDFPAFDEDQTAEMNQWLTDQALEVKLSFLENESCSHPAHQRYWPADMSIDGLGDYHDWDCAPPAGDGWFTLSIHDTEDGPVWVWVRRQEGENNAR